MKKYWVAKTIELLQRYARSRWLQLLMLSGVVLLLSCTGLFGDNEVDKIKARGELIVVTRNAPTTYYEGRDGRPAGFEYALASAYARYLGVRLRIIQKDTISDILNEVATGKADIAAAGLTRTEGRSSSFLFGPAYQQVNQQVICRRGGRNPASVKDLEQVQIMVPEVSSYAERLQELRQYNPGLKWKLTGDLDTEQLLEMVWNRKLDCTVADSNIFAVNQRYLPELRVAFNLAEPESLVWVMANGASSLKRSVTRWFRDYKKSGGLDRAIQRYYGFMDSFDYVDIRRYRTRIYKVLPKYRDSFKQAADENKMDWMLLASLSYQESHWNPRAKSPTGVRGMMMLTLPTARQLGVKSRLDARENIFAGARYFTSIRNRLPETIQEPDRTWLALAAYNIGYGHLLDARELAVKLNKNPDSWGSISEVLPLLMEKKYYHTLTHGYARGVQAVHYVNRIRDYRDILRQAKQ